MPKLKSVGTPSQQLSSDIFYVEKVVQKRLNAQGTAFEYMVRWLGYKLADDTWEPEENIADTPAFATYLQTCQNKSSPVFHVEAAVVQTVEAADGSGLLGADADAAETEVAESDAVTVEARVANLRSLRYFSVTRYQQLEADKVCPTCGGTWPAGSMTLATFHKITSQCRQWYGFHESQQRGADAGSMQKRQRGKGAAACRQRMKYAHLLIPPASGAWPVKRGAKGWRENAPPVGTR